ncbi:glycine-rich domain-containing protein, partial [Pantoea ananatis]|uniref:glycine-rich domain-containing protein n=2 Tax=Pantoea ananas TaxID=553 RepID=UPI003F93342F
TEVFIQMQLLINSLEHPKNLGLNEMLLGRLLKVNLFSQSTTYVKPAARLLKIIVTGGGGGGGGTAAVGTNQGAVGSGGGAGGTAISWYSVDELEFPILITVGKGGSGGVGSNEPQSGQSSSFGRYLSASSGARAASGTAFNYGENRLLSNGGGGQGYGGNHMNVKGSAGTPAITLSSGYESGGGGASYFCAGGNPIAAGSAFSGDPGALGSGGGGGFSVSNSSAQTGGNGGDGLIIIEEYA